MKDVPLDLLGNWASVVKNASHSKTRYTLSIEQDNSVLTGELKKIQSHLNSTGESIDREITVASGSIVINNRDDPKDNALEAGVLNLGMMIGQTTFHLVQLYREKGVLYLEFLSNLEGSPVLFQKIGRK